MSQSRNIGFRFHNIVRFICIGIMAMDKITTHILKRNSYVNKFQCKLSDANINQLLRIMGGGVHMNIFKKLKNYFLRMLLYVVVLCKLIPTHIYKAQAPNGNQLLRTMGGGGGGGCMNIFKKSKINSYTRFYMR